MLQLTIILIFLIQQSIQLVEPYIENPLYISQSASDTQVNQINILAQDLVETIETSYTVWFRLNIFEQQDKQNIETRTEGYIHISGLYNSADISQGCGNDYQRWSTLYYQNQNQMFKAYYYKDGIPHYTDVFNNKYIDLSTLHGQWVFVYQGYSLQTQEAITFMSFTDNITPNLYGKDINLQRTQDPLFSGLSLVLGNCSAYSVYEFSGKFFNPQLYYGGVGSSFLSSEAQIQAFFQRIIKPQLYNPKNDQMFYELQGNTEMEITSSNYLMFEDLEEFSHYNEYAVFGWFKINYYSSGWQEILRLTNSDATTDVSYCGDRQIGIFYLDRQIFQTTYNCYYNTLNDQIKNEGQNFQINDTNNSLDQWIWIYQGYKYDGNKSSRYYYQESDQQTGQQTYIYSNFKLFNPLIKIGIGDYANINPFRGLVKNIYISLGVGSYLESGFEVFRDNLQDCPDTHKLIPGTPNKYQICESQCVTCSTSISTCITCTYTQNRSPPVCDCDDNYFGDLDGSICTQCDFPCQNCRHNSTTCISCVSKYKLNPQDYTCTQCSNAICETCNINDECLSCIENYFYESSNNTCIECNHKCNKCDTSTIDCIDCSDDNRVFSNNCECIDTLYDDGHNTTCQPCQIPCINCISEFLCTSCIDHTYLDNNQCIQCDITCNLCSYDNGCLSNECKVNRINDNQNQRCVCSTEQSGIDHELEGNTGFILCSTCEEAGYIQNLTEISILKMEFSIELKVNDIYTEDITIYNNQLCIQIFDQQSRLLFGEFPQCKILTVTQNGRQESSIYIQFSYTSTYQPNQLSNSNIVFNQNFLQRVDPNCQNTQFINQIELISQTTSYTTVLPVISITGATKLLYCQDLEINIIDSQYDGYRELSSIDWVFTYEYNLDNTNHIDELNNSFSINFQNLYNFKLPKFNLLEGGKYTLNITYSNYLGMTGTKSVYIIIGEQDIAQLEFVENIMPLVFEPWEQIFIDIQLMHLKCEGNQLKYIKNTQLFYSIELLDNLQDLNSIENLGIGQSQKELQNIVEYQLEKYKYIPNQIYYINFIAKLSETDQSGQNLILQFSVQSAPLLHYFKGGSGVQSYTSELILDVIFKDLNVIESQQQLGFTQFWSCIDLNQDLPCENVEQEIIQFNENDSFQQYPAKNFNPYITYKFSHKIQKNQQESIQKIVITVIEMDAPNLALTVPDQIQIQTVNLNDNLQLEIFYPKNPDDLIFSIIFIYELDKVAIKPFYYTKFSFKIMDLFNNFVDGKTDLIIKISCYDLDFLMPAVATFKVTANLPPINGNLQVTPEIGTSIVTQFRIEALSFVDFKFSFIISDGNCTLLFKRKLILIKRSVDQNKGSDTYV